MLNKKAVKLNKYLDVVLGRTPDKFGLLPDENGYVKTKELLKALSEDKDFGPVNAGLLKEVMLTMPEPSIEMEENRIRARDRSLLPEAVYVEEPPKLLFVCVRNRAYPVILERGLETMDGVPVKLTADKDAAIRYGKRKDANPVLLTVNTAQAFEGGALFRIYGESLYLCDFLPRECVSGPPLPKEDPAPAQKQAGERKRALEGEEYHPGSYYPHFGDSKWEQADPEFKKKKKREIREKKLDKKKDIRNKRREKNKMFDNQ